MGYQNFKLAVFCSAGNINHISDFEAFEENVSHILKSIDVDKVYLENLRGTDVTTEEQLIKMRDFFRGKGIQTSGGITTCADVLDEGYLSLCYSDPQDVEKLDHAVRVNSRVFDEFILDDFYFTNCRCEKCIEKKKNLSWSEFRMAQKLQISKEHIMKPAKEENPNVNVILKYPQWYEDYNETGYDLLNEPPLFDSIYTGTETRNPDFAQQHLPKYLSYFIMRYLETAKPGHNLGGWFDPYECTYNLTSYLEQLHLTLYGKAKEVTLFCLDSLMIDPMYKNFAPAIGQALRDLDAYLGELGNPVGAVCYRPVRARGEDNLHNYLGMCGLPLDADVNYPKDAKVVVLTEGSSYDEAILDKMKESLINGNDVVVTSGFVRAMGQAFTDEFVNVTYTCRKAYVDTYANSKDNGLSVSGCYPGKEKILIPQLDYCTNDIWELAAAYGNANNYPLVLRMKYAKGYLSIVTIPDNYGDLYMYPREVLNVLRQVIGKNIFVSLDAPSQIMLFVYDNDTFILRSDLPYNETVTVRFNKKVTEVFDIRNKQTMKVENNAITMNLSPGVDFVAKIYS